MYCVLLLLWSASGNNVQSSMVDMWGLTWREKERGKMTLRWSDSSAARAGYFHVYPFHMLGVGGGQYRCFLLQRHAVFSIDNHCYFCTSYMSRDAGNYTSGDPNAESRFRRAYLATFHIIFSILSQYKFEEETPHLGRKKCFQSFCSSLRQFWHKL